MNAAGLIRIGMMASLVLLVLSLGMRSTFSEASYLFRKPALLLRSLVSMNVVLPLLVIWLVTSFDLRPAVKIALVALAVAPVPPFLPGKQLKLADSHDFTIGLLVATSLFSVLIVPATMALIEALGVGSRHVSAAAILRIVATTVLLPLIAGIFVRTRWPALAARVQPVAHAIAVVLLVVALIPVLFSEWGAMRSLIGDGTLLVILVATVLGLAVGHVLGGPQAEDRSVLALATASRHPAVAIAIASASFPDAKLVLPAVLLALVVGMVASAPYVSWRKRFRRRSQPPMVDA